MIGTTGALEIKSNLDLLYSNKYAKYLDKINSFGTIALICWLNDNSDSEIITFPITPIQVTKKSQTYKLEADERFKELYKFIKSEFDGGKSMFEILEKVAKLKVDKTA